MLPIAVGEEGILTLYLLEFQRIVVQAINMYTIVGERILQLLQITNPNLSLPQISGARTRLTCPHGQVKAMFKSLLEIKETGEMYFTLTI